MPNLVFHITVPDNKEFASLKRAFDVYGVRSKEKMLQGLIVQAAVLATENLRNIGEIIDNNIIILCPKITEQKRNKYGS